MSRTRRKMNLVSTSKDIADEISKRFENSGYNVSLGATLGIPIVFPAGFSISVSKKRGSFNQMDAIETAMDIVDELVSEGDGKRHVVVVDEYRFLSENDYIELKSHVEVFYNVLEHSISRVLEERGSSLAYIITTSDAAVTKMKVGGSKERYILMWNLPRGATERIAEGIGIDKELAWKLSGGNPRALADIKAYGLEKWIEGLKIEISGIIMNITGGRRDKIEEYLEYVGGVEADPDQVPGSREMFEAMLRENILIMLTIDVDRISEISEEPWIGKYFAYQVPAYYYILKAMAKKRSIDIESREIIEHL
jgi:hypothetical protein